MQESGPITTEDSKEEGRLKVDAGRYGLKKRRLREIIRKHKKDGCGGSGFLPSSYGMPRSVTTFVPKIPVLSTKNKPHRTTTPIGGVKKKGIKSVLSSIKSLSKKMRFPKVVKSLRVKSLKSMLKNL